MKIETKLGLLTILILLCVFSYVVYEKWEERNAIIAAGGDPDAKEVVEDEPKKTEEETAPSTPQELFAQKDQEVKTVAAENPFPESEQQEMSFDDSTEPNFADDSAAEPNFDQQLDDGSPFSDEVASTELAQNDNFDPASEFNEQGEDVFGSSDVAQEEPAGFNDNGFGDEVAMNNQVFDDGSSQQEFAPAPPEEFESFEADELNEFNQSEPADNSFAATEEPLVDEFADTTEQPDAFQELPAENFEPEADLSSDTFSEKEEVAATAEEESPFEEFSTEETAMEEPALNDVAEEGAFEEFSSPSELAQLQNEPVEQEAPFAEPESLDAAPFEDEVAADEQEFASDEEFSNEADLGFDEPAELEVARIPERSATTKEAVSPPQEQPLFNENPGFYQVERGDNLWKISKKLYGSGKYANALGMFNRKILPSPSKLKLGMELETPQLAELKQFWMNSQQNMARARGNGAVKDPFAEQQGGFFVREETGEPYYVIQPEDTLTGISQRHLGRASRWIQIVALNKNRIKDPKTLKPGTTLRLPADASPVQLSSGTFETDRR